MVNKQNVYLLHETFQCNVPMMSRKVLCGRNFDESHIEVEHGAILTAYPTEVESCCSQILPQNYINDTTDIQFINVTSQSSFLQKQKYSCVWIASHHVSHWNSEMVFPNWIRSSIRSHSDPSKNQQTDSTHYFVYLWKDTTSTDHWKMNLEQRMTPKIWKKLT